MKNQILLSLVLMVFAINALCQDSSKVLINFQTMNNQPVSVYEEILIGDIETSGFDTEGFNYQHGTLTKNELLFTAPYSGYFDKSKSIILVMKDEIGWKTKFAIDSKIDSQKWLLKPAGKDYKKSIRMNIIGGTGILFSSFLYGGVAILNWYQNEKYKMDLDYYQNASGEPPQKPKNPGAKYLIPTLTMSLSTVTLIRGLNLYRKNKPMAERIE